ncbi:hypothetical protein LTR53_008035 [Teratosphaeriaceae sp. CCFEE 6253]|nr:hypothetical protein LTR53_008035 [Teratosphaeriaceae sp. CCFEE 6253]
MAKSARSSAIKKNNSGLRKKVFGPVETARRERLNAKLLALAQQPKASKPEMEVEPEAPKTADSGSNEEPHMDVDEDLKAAKSKGGEKKTKLRSSRIQKSKHRRSRNDIAFQPTGRAKSKKGSKR